MKREEILAASRKENKNIDLAGLEINRFAGSISGSVGAMICALISLLSSTIADTMLYSPWVIYFGMVGSGWLVRAIKLKKKSNWVIAALFIALAIYTLIGLINRLLEVAA